MDIYTIYKATNIVNGKSYIGFDSNWPSRQKSHKSQSKTNLLPNSHFHNAIRKHSFDNFSWEVLYQNDDKDHTLKTMEPFYIEKYDTFLGEGYNMTSGGDGIFGHKHSDETKRKMSLAKQGKTPSPESKRKMSLARQGKIVSPETRQKISLAKKGKTIGPHSEEHKRRISISIAQQGKIRGPS